MIDKCPNCAKRLAMEHSFCPNCAFDFRQNRNIEPNNSSTSQEESSTKTQHIEKNVNRSLLVSTAVKLLSILIILSLLTFTYSLIEARPAKAISYFISTFIISILGAILILIIGRLAKSPQNSIINNPFKTILIIILIIGVSKIIGSYQGQIITDESVIQSVDQIFSNATYGVSFKYPHNWNPQAPERKSTLVLLYETSGSGATCNLSVAPQDKDKVESYNAAYFKEQLPKVYKSVDNIKTTWATINKKKVSVTTFNFSISNPNGDIHAKSITLTSLNNGYRFMLIINFPKDNLDIISADVGLMTESLSFIK